MEKECLRCEKLITKISPCRFERTKFCSRECQYKKEKIKCLFCRNFFVPIKKQKYCSHTCYTNDLCGTEHNWGHKISKALKGKAKTSEHIANVIKGRRKTGNIVSFNKSHPNWKGDKAGYSAIHDWVRLRKEGPFNCEDCGVANYKKKRKDGWYINYLQLANISGTYKRDVNDFTWLCPKCHSALDKGRNCMNNLLLQGRSLR